MITRPRLYLPPKPNPTWQLVFEPGFFRRPQYDDFIRRHPNHLSDADPGSIELTDALWRDLVEVMTICDRRFYRADPPGTDRMDYIGPETEGMGDCEDFAATWERMLRDRGVYAGALRLAIATVPWLAPGRNGHAALLVFVHRFDTDSRGILAMDPFSFIPRPLEQLDYHWLAVHHSGLDFQHVMPPAPAPVTA